MRGVRSPLWTLLLFLCLAPKLCSQQNCPLPPSIQPVAAGKNIFSDQQEADLGDVMAESFAHDISVIEDDSLNRHVQDVGDQLIQYLPPNHLRFRFSLIELPEANAFSLVGGRIYVSRKMVALTQSDDELAGVLAHEMGHIVTHQQAIRTTRLFHDVLGVTQVGDRADITDKYHRFLETWRRKPPHLPNEEEAHQYVADQFHCSPWRGPGSLLTPMWICGTVFSKLTARREVGSLICSAALNPSSAASGRC